MLQSVFSNVKYNANKSNALYLLQYLFGMLNVMPMKSDVLQHVFETILINIMSMNLVH